MKNILLTCLLFGLFATTQILIAGEASSVKVYGHTGCPWTVKTLKYLDKEKVSYTLMDVKNDVAANREFYDRGYKKIPQVLIAGQDEVSGWRKGTLKKLLVQHELITQ